MTRPSLSDWQRQVLADLDAITATYPGEVELQGAYCLDKSGTMQLRLRLQTADIPRIDEGMPLRDHEEFIVTVGASDLAPPRVEVDHLRFLHYAHVLQGHRLCVYLDPSREWDPITGCGGFLDRLFAWLADAAAGRFDAQTALYHAIGGVLHATEGAPTIVVRSAPVPRTRAQHGRLVARTSHRFNLTFDRPSEATEGDHVPVVTLDTDLPFGAGADLELLMSTVDDPYCGHPAPDGGHVGRYVDADPSAVVLTVLGASAIRKAEGSPQRLVLAVPHPTGGPPHLLAANIPPAGADRIRALVRSSRTRSSMVDIDPAAVQSNTALEWWRVSDERDEVTTRRDSARPVAAFDGKTVQVWGCGGLGSWIAEYVVRAGAKKMLLCDPGRISGGLLVRQNFVEADIGSTKVEALARRLHAISDSVKVVVRDAMAPLAQDLSEADLIVDATVSVSIGRLLNGVADTDGARPVLAQIATDAQTGTLGIMSVSVPPLRAGPLAMDRMAGQRITQDGSYEAFHCLWESPAPGDEIIPTRGCSTPTFHGSAADLAAVAASLTSILGAHLGTEATISGTHLISLPHGEAGPLRTFVPTQGLPIHAGSSLDSTI